MRFPVFYATILFCCCLGALAIPLQPRGITSTAPNKILPVDAPPVPPQAKSTFSRVTEMGSSIASTASNYLKVLIPGFRVKDAVLGAIYPVNSGNFGPMVEQDENSRVFPTHVICYSPIKPGPRFAAIYEGDQILGDDLEVMIENKPYHVYVGSPFKPKVGEKWPLPKPAGNDMELATNVREKFMWVDLALHCAQLRMMHNRDSR